MKFNPSTYADQWEAKHHSYEKYAYNQFKPALDSQVKAVKEHVKLYGGLSDTMINMLVAKKPIEAAYKAVYINIGTLNAAWVLSQINKQKSLPKLFSEKWRRFMEQFFTDYGADRVSDVTNTTRDKIKLILSDSENLPISQRADYIVEQLDNPAFNRSRALTIARTETTAAANQGASLGNADADYETNKMWISVLDRNTRPDHVTANGQIVANTELFLVGSSYAQYPGDLSLPAAECVNCRCGVAYVPVIKDGHIVLKN